MNTKKSNDQKSKQSQPSQIVRNTSIAAMFIEERRQTGDISIPSLNVVITPDKKAKK